jgi:tRNA 2-thiouridine synthesizing protein A
MTDQNNPPIIDLDVKKLLCPLPVIRVQQAIKNLKAGDILRVRATDPGVKHDIPAWCRIHGHLVREIRQLEKELQIEIEIRG